MGGRGGEGRGGGGGCPASQEVAEYCHFFYYYYYYLLLFVAFAVISLVISFNCCYLIFCISYSLSFVLRMESDLVAQWTTHFHTTVYD